MADVILLSILLLLYIIWGYTRMGVHQIKAPSAGQKSHGFAIGRTNHYFHLENRKSNTRENWTCNVLRYTFT